MSTQLLKRLAGESVIYGISGTAHKLIGLFLIPLYTRIFTLEEYGVIALLLAVSTFFNIFLMLGLDNAAARWFYDSEELEPQQRTIATWFWSQLIFGVCVMGVMLLLVPWVSDQILDDPAHTKLLYLVVLAIPFSTFLKVTFKVFRFRRLAWRAALWSVLTALGTASLIVLFVAGLEWGLLGLYTGELLALSLIAVVAMALVPAWFSPRRFDKARLRQMLVFGLPFVPAAVATWVRISSDRIILQGFWPGDELGLFALGFQLSSGVGLFTNAFDMAYGPFAFSIHKRKDATEVYAKVLLLFTFIGSLLCVGVSLFDRLLLSIIATEAYLGAATCVPMLCFSFIFYGMVGIAAVGPGIVKKASPVAMSIFFAAVVSLAMNFALIPSFGREGAALSNMCSSLTAAVYLFIKAQRHYPIPYPLGKTALCVLAAWAIIGVDTFLIPPEGWLWHGARALLCLAFVFVGVGLGILRPGQLKALLATSPQSPEDPP